MSFQPVLFGTGLTGWKVLQKRLPEQLENYGNSPAQQRDTDYFRKTIQSVQTAEDLTNDRRLLRVALGAFGLQDDINNRFFIRKILEEGTREPKALANRLADDRYSKFSAAFGFDQFSGPNTYSAAFAEDLINRFIRGSFEVAVGENDETMRLALNAQRELGELAATSGSTDTKWFLLMGTPPLRTVFETALNLPNGLSNLDIDQQLDIFKERSEARFKTSELADFADEDMRESLIEHYLLQSQLANDSAVSGASIALTLLQSVAR